VQPKGVNLNQLVADHLQSSPRILKQNVKVEFMSEEGLGNIYADPTHIGQALTSLFVNANNAMPKGGELILLTRNVRMDAPLQQSISNDESDRYVMLSVTDTGNRMNKSALNQIFEPFSTGDMKVRTTVGEGSTFQIYFPAVDEIA
jgi:two-component system cell cycle sensor histidine kinase/response regulator CckA